MLRSIDLQSAYQKIVVGIQKYVGNKTAIIGISGGIDSALVASLCVEALGQEKVFGVMLPYGEQKDIKDSYALIQSLNIPSELFNIQSSVDAMVNQLSFAGHEISRLAKANIMARIRMNVLYFFSGSKNGLVIGTTNQTEYKIGYFTKFGDGACDLEPIVELYKTEVWQLSEIMGNIPQTIIDKKPTAGLWDGQTDEEEIGVFYPDLDQFLQGDSNVVNLATADRIRKMITTTEHKRHLPPFISIM